MPVSEHFDAAPLWQWLVDNERSVNWLARRSEWSEAYVRSVKGGHRPATRRFAERIAAALELPIERLFVPIVPPKSGETPSKESGGTR